MNQQELRHLIDQAGADGRNRLTLRNQGLTELPPEIGQLTRLTSLDLSNNRLTTIPSEIGQLTSLTVLRLGGNKLRAVPSEIKRLMSLTSLILSRNQLTAFPSEIGQLTSLTSLHLSDNELNSMPPEIRQLTSLTSLNLNRNKLTAVPPEIGQLTSLTSLNLGGNQLTVIPPEIGQLTSLVLLILESNELTAVPPEIGQLTRLSSLDLRNNQLMVVPSEIGQLTSLTSLNLYDNRLTTIPLEIGNLTRLSSLVLSLNQLSAVPSEIGQLMSLTSLYLSDNELAAVPPEIGHLTSLTSLNLDGNRLTAVPPEIGQLTSLTSLNLSLNQITVIPPEIGQLTSLTSLGLRKSKLTAVPPEISQLTSLTSLNLYDNQLTAIPSEIGHLTSLTKLDLRYNQLDHLPETLQQLTKLKMLDLRSNPALDISQEVLEEIKNPLLILKAYFGEHCPLHEAKMLLVGQGGVGKTALTRRLLHNLPPDNEQGKTEGVDIHKWQVNPSNADTPITLNLWDFGGQGVYQATHQFFFTSRSLYLVVVNARTGEQESRLRHWLKLVASLSDNAPIIIVVNKQDEHALQLDERELKHKYPSLLNIIATSCTTGAGIFALQEAIAAALSHMPHIYDNFPTDWMTLKSQLEKMDSNYITYERYAEYCHASGIHDRADQRSWVQVLHQLGVVLNYQDENYRQLEGTHVLKPEWVTDGVYRILSDPDQRIANNAGILTSAMLDRILDPADYPHHQQAFIVGMMQKFELSFRLPNGQNQHLIPDLLPKEQPEIEAGFFERAQFLLEFQIHYTDFLPDSILSRFMVGMMAALDLRASWRNGAVLQFGGNRALVRADLDTRKLFITVAGAEATRRSMLNSIRMQLHAIHVTFPNLPLTEHIPIPNHPGKTIDYEELLWYETEGMLYPPYAPIRGKIDVKALLDGIETPALRRERKLQVRLMQKYNLDELAQLYFDLAVDFEELPGSTKSAKTRELVQYMGRNGRLDALEAAMRVVVDH